MPRHPPGCGFGFGLGRRHAPRLLAILSYLYWPPVKEPFAPPHSVIVRAWAPCSFVMRPASAAFTSPARSVSFLLIVSVSMGRHFHGAVGHDISIAHQQARGIPLTTPSPMATLGAPS